MTTIEKTTNAIHHIARFRPRPSVRLLDVTYGPRAKPLRTQVMAMLLDHKVTGSDPCVQWNNFRKALLELVGAAGNCTAAQDADFETKAAAILDPDAGRDEEE